MWVTESLVFTTIIGIQAYRHFIFPSKMLPARSLSKGKYTVMILFCNNVICSMLIGPMPPICSVLSSARF